MYNYWWSSCGAYYVKYIEVQSCSNLWLAKMVCFGAFPMQLIKPFLKKLEIKQTFSENNAFQKKLLLFWYDKTYSDYFEVITKPLVYSRKINIFWNLQSKNIIWYNNRGFQNTKIWILLASTISVHLYKANTGKKSLYYRLIKRLIVL